MGNRVYSLLWVRVMQDLYHQQHGFRSWGQIKAPIFRKFRVQGFAGFLLGYFV